MWTNRVPVWQLGRTPPQTGATDPRRVSHKAVEYLAVLWNGTSRLHVIVLAVH